MKRTTILMAAFLCLFSLTESPAQNTHKNMEQLNLTQEWDTFHMSQPFTDDMDFGVGHLRALDLGLGSS